MVSNVFKPYTEISSIPGLLIWQRTLWHYTVTKGTLLKLTELAIEHPPRITKGKK